MAKVPRFFWTFLSFAIYTIAAVVGRNHFAAIISNFLAVVSYWVTFFVVIVAEEHFFFRSLGGRLGGYNLKDYDTPNKLPLGAAGMFAALCGVVGAVMGMANAWYIGPIAELLGDGNGADLGFEVSFTIIRLFFACKSLICTIAGCCVHPRFLPTCTVVGDLFHRPLKSWN